MINRAIREFYKHTCVNFIARRSSDKDYVSIENVKPGCSSNVGRTGGKQVVNLQSPNCIKTIGTPMHELLHAVGFKHEHNREDRDDFVIIHKQNIKPGKENNFIKYVGGKTTAFNIPYDFGSVMHYSGLADSRNKKATIEAKTKTKEVMGQRKGFSLKDIEKINKMYKC